VSAQHGPGEPADGLAPAERFLGSLALLLTDRITGMAAGAGVECRAPRPRIILRNVGGDIKRATGGDEVSGIVTLVAARCIARHERRYQRNQQVLELEHYLDVLERKPGALAGSKPLAAWRQRGLWPESYDRLLEQLIGRHGKQSGTRQMIQVLNLIKQHGHARVRAAVEEALSLGCGDAAAILHLAAAEDLVHTRGALIELGELARFERPLPVMTNYDALLGQEVAS